MVKILNKCIQSILGYNLFLDRQRNILYAPQYFYTRYIGCFHKIEIQIFKNWAKKTLIDITW